MVFNKQGQKTGVKGFTYELSGSSSIKAGFFQSGVKENFNVWVKQYTSSAAFNAADAKFGSAGQVGGPGVRTQSPNSASSDTTSSDLFAVHQVPDGTVDKSGDTGQPHPEGLCYDGQYLFAVDLNTPYMYRYDPSTFNRVGNPVSVPGSRSTGLTFDGTYFWKSDGGSSGFIYQFKRDGTKVKTFNSPFGNTPAGITFDGSYLWLPRNPPQGTNGHIYKMKTDATLVDNFTIPSDHPSEIGHDGKYLWWSDATSGNIYRYDKNGNQISSFDPVGTASNNPPTGIAWDGHYLTHNLNTGPIYRVTGSASLDLSYQVSGFTIQGILSIDNAETMNLTDQYNRVGDFFRDYNETTTLADSLTKSTKKTFVETVNISDQQSTEATLYRLYSENLTLTDVYTDNFGTLTGFVYNSGNAVANAYVFAVSKTDSSEFLGVYHTNNSGKFKFEDVQEDIYLVAADWYDSANDEYFGDERSIDFNPS